MGMNIKNIIYKLIGYAIGFTVINFAIPEMTFKNFALVTAGGCIIIITALLFDNKKEK